MNMLRGSPQECKKKVLFTELKGPSGFRFQYARQSKRAGFIPHVFRLAWPAYTANTAYWGAFAPRAL